MKAYHFSYGLFALLFSLFTSISPVYSQEKIPVTFGKISPEDFNLKSSLIDSNTNAVIVADQGDLSFEGNSKGWFTYIFKRSCRIYFYNTKAVGLATIELPLYKKDEYKEKLDKVTATTYTIENGKVVQAKLNADDVFEDKLDNNHSVKKIVIPGVKGGSIVEYSYTIKSDYLFTLPEWAFQNKEAPTLWSEYKVSIPGLLSYNATTQSFRNYDINENGQTFKNYLIHQKKTTGLIESEESFTVSAPVTLNRWVKKNMPAFPVENYISTPNNFIDKIDFQLTETNDGNESQKVADTWKTLSKELLEREDFGKAITENTGWLDNILEDVVKPNDDIMVQAHKIYYYVQNNYACSDHNNYFVKTSLKDVVKKKSGTVGEINLLFLAMLKRKDINGSPVVLSTSNFGKNSEEHPRVDQLNYVICKINLQGSDYLLDASTPFLPFGALPAKCYNGMARMIAENPAGILLNPDSLREFDSRNVVLMNAEKGLKGSYTHTPGFYTSIELRDQAAHSSDEAIKNAARKSFSGDFNVTDVKLESLKDIDKPVSLKLDFDLPAFENTDIIYFTPVLASSVQKNPFVADQRVYPVEMPYPLNEVYQFKMEIPKGYRIEELPKSLMVKLNETEGLFQYTIKQEGNFISLVCKTILYNSTYSREDYESLRNFYAYKVKKEAEQIVFKKMK